VSIPVRFVVQRHATDERFLDPIRQRAQDLAVLAYETDNAKLREYGDDLNHLLCAVVEQRGDLRRMQSQFSKSANGVYATALSKLRAAVVEICTSDDEPLMEDEDTPWRERLDELARVANAIFDEMELQFGGQS
jgi:hypothetical protein